MAQIYHYLKSEVVRITLSVDVAISPRYKREPSHSLADFGSFSRFRFQDKHNASNNIHNVMKDLHPSVAKIEIVFEL